jgi:four helix bundle protein
MESPTFGHERLDVYQAALRYMAEVFARSGQLKGQFRHARDQWLRAAQSIPLNIAEGNGKSGVADRRHYFEIARGSALECAAIQDVLQVGRALPPEDNVRLKELLNRIVAMLTRMSQLK